jgi:hypothetical protein
MYESNDATCLKVKFGQHFAKADSSVRLGISPLANLVAAALNFWPVAPKLKPDGSGSELIFIDLLSPANMLILLTV